MLVPSSSTLTVTSLVNNDNTVTNGRTTTRSHRFLFGPKTRLTLLPIALFIGVTIFNQLSQVPQSISSVQQEKDSSDAPPVSWIEELESSFVRWDVQSSSIVLNITDTSPGKANSIRAKHNPSVTYRKVSLKPEEVFMWKGRQRKLCKRLKKESHQGSRSLLFFGVPCQELHDQHRHGNLLYGFYAMHIAAAAHDADLLFACREKNYYKNLFWWIQSLPYTVYLKRELLLEGQSSSSPTVMNPSSTCDGMGKLPFQYASHLVTYDLRRMALAMAGPQTSSMKQYATDHPELPIPENSKKQDRALPSKPIHATMELDSVAIHFRCGDLLANLNADMNDNYGFLPFYVYASLLTKKDLTIGIVTAPFDHPDQLRKQDAHHGSKCQQLVETFRDYLQDHAPWARITIRNDPKESIPMVLSRLVLADQTSICIRSTFCVFATLASFAQQRVFLEGGVSYFVSNITDPGLILLKKSRTPYIYSHEIHRMGWNATVQWLLQDENWHKKEIKKKKGRGTKKKHR